MTSPHSQSTESTKIRVVIVDDEELGRDRIQALLEQQPDVEIIGICADGPSAVETLERTRLQLARNKGPVIDSRIVSLLEELREERKYPERLIVKSSGRVFFVRTEEIDWVEASGNYVKIHTKAEAHLLRESMKNMEAKLDPKTFVRIHRSAIVNIDRIKELEPWFHGEYIVIMRDGTRLTASRVFSDRLSALIA